MGRRRIAKAIAALGIVLVLAGCASTGSEPEALVSGIDPQDRDLARELQALDSEIAALEPWLSHYPGAFQSTRERIEVAMRWRGLVERAVVLLNIDLSHPELWARVGELYRQGHNLDIPDAATAAYSHLTQCLALDRDHVECHFSLARLFLASSTQYAARAEHHLERVRALTEPDSRPDVEAALARAYLAQGRRSAALRQIDHYLTLRPDDPQAQRFRKVLLEQVESGR